jgi:predicted nucleic acid-binding protein
VILVDTSVLIDFLKGTVTEGSQKLEYVLRQKLPFGISPFTMQEVLQGAATEKEFGLLKAYLSSQQIYHLKDNTESLVKAAKICMDCRKKGIAVRSTIDCIIAQTAIERNVMLLHSDDDFVAMAKVIPLRFY